MSAEAKTRERETDAATWRRGLERTIQNPKTFTTHHVKKRPKKGALFLLDFVLYFFFFFLYFFWCFCGFVFLFFVGFCVCYSGAYSRLCEFRKKFTPDGKNRGILALARRNKQSNGRDNTVQYMGKKCSKWMQECIVVVKAVSEKGG
ncbi:hypothetical protein [Escherichia coli]|uniref:hypothetical protein n=1 Tax=Escherichia coli TaxID=562 RepID=UPI002284E853|nr:hypothetical protein [Escherichia coli]MCY9494939.1 hypothetical protein [Escherichia coli]